MEQEYKEETLKEANETIKALGIRSSGAVCMRYYLSTSYCFVMVDGKPFKLKCEKATFDGRDCFIVALCDNKGKLLFNDYTKRYDPEATSEHTTLEQAKAHAKELAKRRGAISISFIHEDRTHEGIPLWKN